MFFIENINIILFDWLSFTAKYHSVESIIEFLGLTDDKIKWVSTYGMRTYKDRFLFNEISIHFNSSKNEGVWVEMSGQGCRAFEEFGIIDWSVIFQTIIDSPDEYNITRLDVAYDDHIGLLDLKKIKRETENLHFISKFKDPVIQYSVRSKAITAYFGSKSSNIYMRCYDKAKERCREDIDHWVRWEIVFKDENALNFIQQLKDNGIGFLFFGVINNYLRFIIPDPEETNLSRLKLAKWWSKWLDSLIAISVYTPKNTDYNLFCCENFGYIQAGNAVDTLIQIKGVDTFLKELKERKPSRSIKYQALLNSNNSTDRKLDPIQEFLKERGAL